MTITKKDINKALENLDDDLRADFLGMTPEEQMTIILSMSGSNSNRLAIVEKWQIDFERGTQLYRAQRERRESSDDESLMSTTQKILKAIQQNEATKFNYWIWFRDRVLPTVITIITLAILALTFGVKLP